jgi:hypothetical protein
MLNINNFIKRHLMIIYEKDIISYYNFNFKYYKSEHFYGS